MSVLSCAMLVAPMIVLVTNGRDTAKAIAIRIEPMLASKRDVRGDRLWAVSLLITSETVEHRLARAWRERAAFIFAGEVALAEGRVAKQADLLALGDLGESAKVRFTRS